MSYISIILLAIALSIDACVVSFSYGLAFTENRFKNAIRLAACTGLFQGLMPVIGYYLTGFVKSFIEPYAGFIVFAIFTYLGVKFIKEAFEKEKEKQLCIDLKCLLLVGIATSIDALAVGVSFAAMNVNIFIAVSIIAAITFACSMIAVLIGKKCGDFLNQKAELFGGCILILIGLKIFLDGIGLFG